MTATSMQPAWPTSPSRPAYASRRSPTCVPADPCPCCCATPASCCIAATSAIAPCESGARRPRSRRRNRTCPTVRRDLDRRRRLISRGRELGLARQFSFPEPGEEYGDGEKRNDIEDHAPD